MSDKENKKENQGGTAEGATGDGVGSQSIKPESESWSKGDIALLCLIASVMFLPPIFGSAALVCAVIFGVENLPFNSALLYAALSLPIAAYFFWIWILTLAVKHYDNRIQDLERQLAKRRDDSRKFMLATSGLALWTLVTSRQKEADPQMTGVEAHP